MMPDVEPEGAVVAVSRKPTHGVDKPNADVVLLVVDRGVEGDAHFGTTVQHRSRVAKDPTAPNLRQVHLIGEELLDALRAARFPVAPGKLGENITTRNVPLLGLPTGTRLQLGATAVVELTGLRNPCRQLEALAPGLLDAVLERDATGALVRKAGVMGSVTVGGPVRAGDRIRVVLPPTPHRALAPV